MKIHKQKITEISKERYKNIVSKHVKEHAIIEIIERKDKCVSEYARGKLINYDELDMQEYLMGTSMGLSDGNGFSNVEGKLLMET